LGDPLKGNLLLFYKPLHLEAQQVSTRIEVRRHHRPPPPPKHPHQKNYNEPPPPLIRLICRRRHIQPPKPKHIKNPAAAAADLLDLPLPQHQIHTPKHPDPSTP
jgi:hypothetical protein